MNGRSFAQNPCKRGKKPPDECLSQPSLLKGNTTTGDELRVRHTWLNANRPHLGHGRPSPRLGRQTPWRNSRHCRVPRMCTLLRPSPPRHSPSGSCSPASERTQCEVFTVVSSPSRHSPSGSCYQHLKEHSARCSLLCVLHHVTHHQVVVHKHLKEHSARCSLL